MQRWRRTTGEVLSLIGCVATLASLPAGHWRSFVWGITACAVVAIPLFEWIVSRKDRQLADVRERNAAELGQIQEQKDANLAELQERFDQLVIFNDPATLEMWREDERERLRIEREAKERANKSAQRAADEMNRGAPILMRGSVALPAVPDRVQRLHRGCTATGNEKRHRSSVA